MKQRAIFLDGDSFIKNEIYHCHPSDIPEIPLEIAESIKLLKKEGFTVIILTDRSGIAQDKFNVENAKDGEENNIDLTSSFCIADRIEVLEPAANRWCKCILVRSGHGEEELKQRKNWKTEPDFIADDLLGAVDWIVGIRQQETDRINFEKESLERDKKSRLSPIARKVLYVTAGLFLLVFISAGFFINRRINQGKLVYACSEGNFALVKQLIESDPSLINTKDPQMKYNMLYFTFHAENHRLEILDYLLSKGADINNKDIMGRSPLYWTLFYEKKDALEFLLSKGANIEARDDFGSTPIHWAAGLNFKGGEEIVKILLEKGANVNARNNEGYTPLHSATFLWLRNEEGLETNLKMVSLLIEHGADLTARNKEGKTAMDLALIRGLDDFVKLLKKKGAKE